MIGFFRLQMVSTLIQIIKRIKADAIQTLLPARDCWAKIHIAWGHFINRRRWDNMMALCSPISDILLSRKTMTCQTLARLQIWKILPYSVMSMHGYLHGLQKYTKAVGIANIPRSLKWMKSKIWVGIAISAKIVLIAEEALSTLPSAWLTCSNRCVIWPATLVALSSSEVR
jgi:hypothetical protein